jgi:hypothetical protein
MPIRLNLLAEAQAAEELRRRDPVKRTLWVAGAVGALLVLWCFVLYGRLMVAGQGYKALQREWSALEKANMQSVAKRRTTIAIENKIAALERLNTNRFLWGNAFNALQQTLVGIEDIQVVRLKTDQTFIVTEEPKPHLITNAPPVAASRSVTNKPATATERITMLIEAMDSSTPPGSQVSKFKETIAAVPFFAESLQKTNGVLLTTLSAPQISPAGGGSFVTFSLQCSFTEKVRLK